MIVVFCSKNCSSSYKAYSGAIKYSKSIKILFFTHNSFVFIYNQYRIRQIAMRFIS